MAAERGEFDPAVDPDTLALGIETVVLGLLMSSVRVPGEADRRVPAVPAVPAVFQALFRPAS